MKVMTSCSLRPASRAKKPPIAWMPSCELPAMRITASLTVETLGSLLGAAGEDSASLMGQVNGVKIQLFKNSKLS